MARPGTMLCVVFFALSLCASVSDAAIGLGKNIAVELIGMDTPTDLAISSLFIFVGYTFQYVGLSGLFEVF